MASPEDPLKKIDPKAFNVVLRFYNGNKAKARTWFTLPNPNMGGSSPIALIKAGRGHKVEAILFAFEKGY